MLPLEPIVIEITIAFPAPVEAFQTGLTMVMAALFWFLGRIGLRFFG